MWLGEDWDVLCSLGKLLSGLGCALVVGCRGTLCMGSGMGCGLAWGFKVAPGVVACPLGWCLAEGARCAALSCNTVCPGPQSCSSGVSRPCWLGSQGCKSFGLPGKGRGCTGQSLAGIGVWYYGNGQSVASGISSLRLHHVKLLPC